MKIDFVYSNLINVLKIDFVSTSFPQFCIINESTSSKLQIGEKIEIIDEARCFYVRLNTIDGIPRSYTATINQIRVISTGEEGWTWSKAIEFDQ